MSAADILWWVRLAGDVYFVFQCVLLTMQAMLYWSGQKRDGVTSPGFSVAMVIWWAGTSALWFAWLRGSISGAMT